MRKADAVVAIFWILLGLTISIWSATFPFGGWEAPGPGFLPLFLGLILILLGSILFFVTIKRKEGSPMATFASLIPDRAAFIRVALTLGGMLVSAALFEYLGFVLTVFFLILFLMRAIQPQKWIVAVLYALLSAFGSFVLFKVLLNTTLPRGFLGF